jgi:HAMP domain-containing protein
MQTIVLLVLLPSLLLVTVVMGGVIYSNLQRIIMADGFDRKLIAISTIFGSFVDGDDHAKIIEDRTITGLSPNPSKDLLYGLDSLNDTLVTVNQRAVTSIENYYSAGGAMDIGHLSFKPSRNLAFVPKGDILLTLDDKGNLVRIDPKSGKSRVLGRASASLHGLAFDSKTNTLYGSDHRLAKINPQTGAVTYIGETGFKNVSALAAEPGTGALYGYDSETRRLLVIDAKTGKGRSIGEITPVKGDESQTHNPLRLSSLAFGSDGLYAATEGTTADFHDLYGIEEQDTTINSIIPADRLTKIDPKTAKATLSGYDLGFRNEASPRYRQYFNKMRPLHSKLDITFFYSLVPWQGKWVRYVLDETKGVDDHTPPGTPDLFLDAQANGIKDVMSHHSVYLSDIQAWERWGILKSAYAPIYSYANPDLVEGVAGVDLNVTTIRTKTSEALGKVGLAALLSLIIGTFISFFISRRLTQPIAEVKEVAIQVASGQYGHKIEVSEPAEMAELATTFNLMSETLEENVRETTAANRSLEQRRRKQELLRVLSDLSEDYPSNSPERLAFSWQGEDADRPNVSGFALSGDGTRLLAWIGDAADEPLQIAKIRSDIHAIAKRLLETYGEDWLSLSQRVEHLFENVIRGYILMDSKSGQVHTLARQRISATVIDANGASEIVDLQKTPEIQLAVGKSFLLDSTSREPSEWKALIARSGETSPTTAKGWINAIQRGVRSSSPGATMTQEENGFIAVMTPST